MQRLFFVSLSSLFAVASASTAQSPVPFATEKLNQASGFITVGPYTVLRNGDASLWRTDGTEAGTVRIVPRSTVANRGGWFVRLGSKVLFAGFRPGLLSGLFETDGTAAGTKLVRSFTSGTKSWDLYGFVRVAGKVYFPANPRHAGDQNRQLWVTDGTAAGTKMIWNKSYSGNPPDGLSPLPGSGGKFVFRTFETFGQPARKFWVSDGTTSGTREYVEANSGHRAALPQVAGGLLFAGVESQKGGEPWFTDGTKTGTRPVTELYSGPPSGLTDSRFGLDSALSLEGGKVVYFPGRTAASGVELWRTDGTVAGTRMIKDIVAGSGNGLPHRLAKVGSRFVYFVQQFNNQTSRIWRTDGTTAGTVPHSRQFAGLVGGHTGSGHTRMHLHGNRLMFVVEASTHPIYTYDVGAVATAVGRGCGTATPMRLSATDPVLGQVQTITTEGVNPSSIGLLLLGRLRKTPLVLGSGCESWIDFTKPWIVLDSWAQVSAAPRETKISIPSDPNLRDLDLAMQSWGVTTSPDFEVSNGVHEYLGR